MTNYADNFSLPASYTHKAQLFSWQQVTYNFFPTTSYVHKFFPDDKFFLKELMTSYVDNFFPNNELFV
jgi:hypothetical protein